VLEWSDRKCSRPTSSLQVDAFAPVPRDKACSHVSGDPPEDRLREQLRTILGSALRNELGKRSFSTLLSAERGQVMENIQTALNRQARRFGAEVIDVRIKRADLPEGTPLQSAFARMESARKQEAIAIEAEGQKEAQIIRASAEAEAARIYAASYNKDAISTISTARCSLIAAPSSRKDRKAGRGLTSSCRPITIICGNSAMAVKTGRPACRLSKADAGSAGQRWFIQLALRNMTPRKLCFSRQWPIPLPLN
jgi:hypothetical protein